MIRSALVAALLFVVSAMAIEKVWHSKYHGGLSFFGNRSPVVSADGRIVLNVLQGPNMEQVVVANNASNGAKLWEHVIAMPNFTPHISIANDTVVAVTGMHTRGIHLHTGKKLWTAQVGGTGKAVPISKTSAVLVWTSIHLRSIDMSTGNVTWVASGNAFGECSFFKTPVYNNKDVFIICDTDIVAYDVTTGKRLYRKEHTDPKPVFVNEDMFIYIDLNGASQEEEVVHCIASQTGSHIWKFHPDHQHADGAVATNEGVVVIGTWASSTGLNLTTGKKIWTVANPPGPTFKTHPIPIANSSSIAFWHVQLLEDFQMSLRRVDLISGKVVWNATSIHSNGMLQWNYVESKHRLAAREQHNIITWDWHNGTQLAAHRIREIEVTTFYGDFVYIGKEDKLYCYSL